VSLVFKVMTVLEWEEANIKGVRLRSRRRRLFHDTFPTRVRSFLRLLT
jgi:hypothetical protein